MWLARISLLSYNTDTYRTMSAKTALSPSLLFIVYLSMQEPQARTQQAPRPRRPRGNPYLIPGAIVFAGVMVAGAFFMTRSGEVSTPPPPPETTPAKEVSIRPVSPDDWVRGDPNAKIVVVEYSDYECPFCGAYHETMKEMMETYGRDGSVAWVYRHFPIQELHQQAWPIAIAAECVGELGGNDAFWQFTDRVFENTPGGDGLDMSLLMQFATEVGVNREAFNACRESERTRPSVQEDFDEAVNGAGGTGTPHNVLIAGGQMAALPGALRSDQLTIIIDSILEQLAKGTSL